MMVPIINTSEDSLLLSKRLPIDASSVQKEAVLSYHLDKLEEQVDVFWKQASPCELVGEG
jgi:hypothetical protein